MRSVSLSIVLSLMMLGCDTLPPEVMTQVTGGLIGAAAGSAIGKGSGRQLATITGAFIGSYIGRQWGLSIDKQHEQAFHRTFEHHAAHQSKSWRDQKGGRFVLTPGPRQTIHGQLCRHFTLTYMRGDVFKSYQGLACRQQVDHWLIREAHDAKA